MPVSFRPVLQPRSDWPLCFVQEIKTIQLEEVLNERADEEMEVSDSEDDFHGLPKKRRVESEDKQNLASIKVT